MLFAINRRNMWSGESRLRRVAFIGLFFAINRRNMWSGKSRLRRVAFIGMFLPLFLTFTLIRSSTLTVSTFGVRSYSDQRCWSMQTSGMGQASSASELSAGPATVCTGSVGLTAATSTGGVGIRGESDEAALPLAISAAE